MAIPEFSRRLLPRSPPASPVSCVPLDKSLSMQLRDAAKGKTPRTGFRPGPNAQGQVTQCTKITVIFIQQVTKSIKAPLFPISSTCIKVPGPTSGIALGQHWSGELGK